MSRGMGSDRAIEHRGSLVDSLNLLPTKPAAAAHGAG
jgi:hypothetical protein